MYNGFSLKGYVNLLQNQISSCWGIKPLFRQLWRGQAPTEADMGQREMTLAHRKHINHQSMQETNSIDHNTLRQNQNESSFSFENKQKKRKHTAKQMLFTVTHWWIRHRCSHRMLRTYSVFRKYSHSLKCLAFFNVSIAIFMVLYGTFLKFMC